MDLPDIIQSFGTGTYLVTRRAKAVFVAGRATPGATTTISIEASVQPATGRDLLRLPEGRRTQETRLVYTTTRLTPGAQGAAYEADLVLIEGNTWEVQHVETWHQAPGTDPTAYRAIVQALI